MTIGERIKALADDMRKLGKVGSYILENALLNLHETPEGSVRIFNPNDAHTWKDDVLPLYKTSGYAKLEEMDRVTMARIEEMLKERR
jgi:hypothetical protein